MGGEIGLDRNTHYGAFFDHQVYVLREQLRLAAELHRPVSLHSVRADGALVDCLRAEVKEHRSLPPTICLHSFAGSVDTLKSIIRLVEFQSKGDLRKVLSTRH